MRAADLAREVVRTLPVYEPPRLRSGIRLDANEAPGDGLNRYPDPDPAALRDAYARYLGAAPDRLLVTRGSDDAIDALARTFLCPGEDAIVVSPPTFSMYAIAARLQQAKVVEAPLGAGFRHDLNALLEAAAGPVKLVFVCSPNNPTGTVLSPDSIAALCSALAGRALVVVDEAYQEFAATPGAVPLLPGHGNLVVLRTLSKAFGLAALRIGALLGAPDVVALVRRVLPPYPLAVPAIERARAALGPESVARMRAFVERTRARRERLADALATLAVVREVIAGEGNFVFARFRGGCRIHASLERAGVHVRRFGEPGLADWLRITVGTDEENDAVLHVLREEEDARAQSALR